MHKLTEFQIGERVILSRVLRQRFLGQTGTVHTLLKSKKMVRVRLDSDGDFYDALPENLDAASTGRNGATIAVTTTRAQSGDCEARRADTMTQYRVITRSGDRQQYEMGPFSTLEEAAKSWREWTDSVPVAYIEERDSGGEWRVVLPTEYRQEENLGEWQN